MRSFESLAAPMPHCESFVAAASSGSFRNRGRNFSTTANVDLIRSRCYDHPVIHELPFTPYFRCISKQFLLILLLGFGFALPSNAQTPKPDLPDPIKFIYKFDRVANMVYAVLDDMGYKIELDDRKGGKIVTRPYEFITGTLTSAEVDKVAVKSTPITGSLVKAQYTVEAILEIVSPSETLVTVRTKMEALNRDVDGTEKWIPMDSLGTFERRILGRISTKLLEEGAPKSEKKGFWGKSPQPVDPRRPRYPMPTR